MSEFPQGWSAKTIDEACEIHDFRRIPLSGEQRRHRKGPYPYYGANNIQDYIDDFIFDFDAVLLAEDGGYYDEHEHRDIAQYATGRYWVNNHAHILTGKPGLDTKFLYYALARKNICPWINTGTRSKLNQSDLKQIELLVPPLPEQKKIAEILSGVDTTIAKLKLQAQKLDALRFFLAEELAEVLHSEGELSALHDIAEIRTGIAKNSNSEGDLVELPYMRVANVQDGYLDLSEIKTISVDRGRIARYLLQKGDVLINEGGDLDKVGRGVIWHEEIRECLHQNHVFAVRCSQRLMPEFLSLLLKTTHSKNYFLGCAKQTTNLASINSAQLKSFPIPLPSLDAQNEFINHITSIKQLTSSVSRKISSLAAMKNAISSDLLSGRKRVTL